MKSYPIEVAGVRRELPLCRVHDDLYIAAFVMFGDVEITVAAARELLKIAPQFDVIMTAEAKGIPLAYEMARQLGVKNIFAERENGKMTLRRGFTVEKGTRVLVVEDVVTPGGSVKEVISLRRGLGAEVVGVGSVVLRDIAPRMVAYGNPCRERRPVD